MPQDPRVILYYQTETDLSPVLQDPLLTHIHVAAYHLGKNPDGTPYIHLNDHPPDDPLHEEVWHQLNLAAHAGRKVVAMVGGAARGDYPTLFADYDTFYPILLNEVRTRFCITGVDLDVEETTTLASIQRLVRDLRRDLPPHYTISMAPVAGELVEDEPGMGGFVYKDLWESDGDSIAYFNVQAYGASFREATFDAMVENGYPAKALNMGMIAPVDLAVVCPILSACAAKHLTMGGTFIWEYCEAPPRWIPAVADAMINHTSWIYSILFDVLTAVASRFVFAEEPVFLEDEGVAVAAKEKPLCGESNGP